MQDKKPASWEMLRSAAEPPKFDEYGVPAEAIESFYQAMGAWIYSDAYGFWLEPDAEDGHCEPNKFVFTIGSRMSELSAAYNGMLTKSPIEARLLGALVWLNIDWAGYPRIDWHDVFEEGRPNEDKELTFYITPQAKIATYHVDFLIWFRCGRVLKGFVVECDGHAFHERTKEQAARDKRRDREIQSAGFPVLRFTGSEIFKDTGACAEQISEFASRVLFQASKAGGLI